VRHLVVQLPEHAIGLGDQMLIVFTRTVSSVVIINLLTRGRITLRR
jgi:hypothetical protein